MPPFFCASATTWSARVVLQEDSGPKISRILPRGNPPIPSAISRPREPVGIASMPVFGRSPSFIIASSPNFVWICLSVSSMPVFVSLIFIHRTLLINQLQNFPGLAPEAVMSGERQYIIPVIEQQVLAELPLLVNEYFALVEGDIAYVLGFPRDLNEGVGETLSVQRSVNRDDRSLNEEAGFKQRISPDKEQGGDKKRDAKQTAAFPLHIWLLRVPVHSVFFGAGNDHAGLCAVRRADDPPFLKQVHEPGGSCITHP